MTGDFLSAREPINLGLLTDPNARFSELAAKGAATEALVNAGENYLDFFCTFGQSKYALCNRAELCPLATTD